jgi:hypothetical protein
MTFLAATSSSRKDSVRPLVLACVRNAFSEMLYKVRLWSRGVKGMKAVLDERLEERLGESLGERLGKRLFER